MSFDEDSDDLINLFDNVELNDQIQKKKRREMFYEAIQLPVWINEILKEWEEERNSSESSNSRIGICPCDYSSLDGMYMHTWGESHVEQPSRLTSIINYFHEEFWIGKGYRWKCLQGQKITNEQIKLVHSNELLQDFLLVENGEPVDHISSMRTLSYCNGQCHWKSVGPIVANACRIAAGSTVHLIKSIFQKEIDYGFALVRPAGHHSSTDQIGTFCGFNSISIGAIYALEILKINRVLILDWDVHRSGGTELILRQLSNKYPNQLHLIDIYAAFGKTSTEKASSRYIDLIDMFDPKTIPADNEYLQIFHSKVLRDIIEFNPSIILISAGYDGAEGESEDCARITSQGYFQMTQLLKQLNIPLAFILEGGYQLHSLVQSIGATFQALIQS